MVYGLCILKVVRCHVSWLCMCLQMVQNAYFSNATRLKMQRLEFHTSLGQKGVGLQLKNQLSLTFTTDTFIPFFELPFPFFSLHIFSSLPLPFGGKIMRT